MHTEEWDLMGECCDCGATVSPETGRAFAVDDHDFLCFDCATRRGGNYDARHERWVVAPRLDDLPDERRERGGHAFRRVGERPGLR